MSVVIIGGNECMERQYKDLCEEYNKMRGGSVREVTSTRGTISLKDVIQEDYYD